MKKAYSPLRRRALENVLLVNEMSERSGTAFRESAFDALACEILDAFAEYATLEEVTLTVGVPKVAFQVSTSELVSDFILQIEHNVSLDTEGAYVAEWDEDKAGFLASHLPLSKMGTGQVTVRRSDKAVQTFLNMTEENYDVYRQCVAALMMTINGSFGGQYVQQTAA